MLTSAVLWNRRTERARWLATVLLATLVVAGCSADSGGDDPPEDAASEEEGPASPASDGGGEDADAAVAGVLLPDGPTRFGELDWHVVGVERRPDGPDDEGEDADPSEDFVYVDLDLASTVGDVSWRVPWEWIALADATGAVVRPIDALDRNTGEGELQFSEVEPSRTRNLTIVYAVDASATYDGGWIAIDSGPDYLAAATAGPQQLDEAARIEAAFEATSYDGPFSRDEATVEVVEAYWSRELGVEDSGALIESPDSLSRRPPADAVWLLVRFEVTCRLTGLDTGGCNVLGGQIEVDGARTDGSVVNGLVGYDETISYWAAYPVAVDAQEVRVHISGGDHETDFAAADLTPLADLATPEV